MYLGNLFYDKGDYESAETMFRCALECREKTLGAEHLDTLGSAMKLGRLLYEKGDYLGAEILCRRALNGRQKAIGAVHPDTLSSVNAVSGLLNRLGRRAEALKLLRGFAELSEKARDYVAYNLACYECLEGNIEEAKRLIADYLKMHPDKKNQALEDEDFTVIHECISQL
jgi:tetratricopeptide (TPR) repeat protein